MSDLRTDDYPTEMEWASDADYDDTLFDPDPAAPHAAVHACSGPSCAVCALPDDRPGRARTSDPVTSHEGGETVALRAGSQKVKLLASYFRAAARGLTDDEAALWTGLDRSCFWKRCSELRQDGYIYPLGITRRGPIHNEARIVCAITHKGIEAIA